MMQVYRQKKKKNFLYFLCGSRAWLSSGCPALESEGGGGSLNVSPPLGFSNCFTEYLIASIWKNEAKPECWGMSLSQAIATGLFCPRDSLFHSFYHREVGDGSLACAGAERSRSQPCLISAPWDGCCWHRHRLPARPTAWAWCGFRLWLNSVHLQSG